MSAFKNLLTGNRVVRAGKKRSCAHSKKHVIQKGEACLEVRNGMGWKGYCRFCGEEMIQIAAADVERLRREVSETA